MTIKIYAILTAYNPEKEVLELAVERLLKQVDFVVIGNNSDYDIEMNLFDRCKVFNFGKNLGIAKAQSITMKWAFEEANADFILQMDQDSEPSKAMVTELLNCYLELVDKGYKIGLVGVQDFDKYTGVVSKSLFKKDKKLYCSDYINVSDIISSGSLIPKLSYSVIGGMDDDLFIDIVDHEYCWRLQQKGFLIVKNKRALLGHRLGDGKYKILPFFSVGLSAPVRHYYSVRNSLILMRRDYVPFIWKIKSFIKLTFKVFFYPILLPNGKSRAYFLWKGVKDGILNKKGII